MAGQVRGAFDLNSRPAVSALREIEREGAKADITLSRLGDTVDDVFNERNRKQAKDYEGQLRAVDRQASLSLTKVRREWAATERETLKAVATSEAAIDRLQMKMRSLGATTARPNVETTGIAEALAQTTLLEARLRALGAVTARPRVNVGGGFGGIPGGGGGSRPGRPGGAGGGFNRGLRIPMAGTVPWPLVGAGLAAIPPLTGGLTGLLGSFGMGAIGLGAGAVPGIGAGLMGGALGLPTGIAAGKGIAAASEALTKYQEQVIETGPNSKAAREALRAFNMELREAPKGTKRFLHARTVLGEEFGRASRPAQGRVAAIGTRGLNLGRQLTPQMGRLATPFFDEARRQADQFSDFLASPRSRQFYDVMGAEATRDLQIMESMTENITASMMNISRAARPFWREGLEFVEGWTEGWRQSTNDISETRGEIGGMIDHLRSWADFTSATFDLTGSLFGAAAGPGQSMLESLTEQLREWDRWVERNPREVRSFFRDAAQDTEKIASALSRIIDSLWELGRAFGPLLTSSSQLVTMLSNAGLLTPGGLPLLLAGGAGIRNAMGRGRGAILGTSGGGVAGGVSPVLLGGGAAAGAAGMRTLGSALPRGATYGLARSFGYGRAAAAGAAIGAGAGPAAGRFARGFGARFLPYAGLAAGLGALTTPGSLSEKAQGGLSMATLGLIDAPPTADQKYLEGQEEAAREWRQAVGANAMLGIGGGRRTVGLSNRLSVVNRSIRNLRGEDDLNAFGQGELAYLRDIRGQLRGRQASETSQAIGGIGAGFDIRRRHGASVQEAFGKSSSALLGGLGARRGEDALEFGQQGLSWLQNIGAMEPQLAKQVEKMADRIETRLRRMGQNVRIINGEIRDVSASQWGSIRKKMSNDAEMARQEVMESFTALQVQAIEVLKSMGFTGPQARKLVSRMEQGGARGRGAKRAAGADPQSAFIGGTKLDPHYRGRATGGRLGMPASGSLHDVISLGGGNYAAGGELLIGNRHTERRVDGMLAPYGTTLSREIGREGRAHSEPFRAFSATGSIMQAGKLAERFGLSVGEGPGYGGVPSAGHAAGSLHYQGLAYDVSGSAQAMRRYFFAALRQFRGSINELFHDPIGFYIDNGQRVPGAIGDHGGHVHIGFDPQGAVGGRLQGGGMGRAMGRPPINLKSPRSGRGGLLGAGVNQAGEMMAAGMSQRLNQMTGAGGGRGMGGARGGLNAWLARALRITGHYNASNLSLLRGRAMQESGGDPRAVNDWDSNAAAGTPSKGLLQTIGPTFDTYSLPGMGNIFNPVHNAVAAIRYMMARYGHIVGPGGGGYATGGRIPGFAGWYARGGHFRVKGPTLFGAGENGTEDVNIQPLGRRGGGGGRPPISVSVDLRGAAIHGTTGADRIGKKVGRSVAKELAAALDNSDSTPERQLTG